MSETPEPISPAVNSASNAAAAVAPSNTAATAATAAAVAPRTRLDWMGNPPWCVAAARDHMEENGYAGTKELVNAPNSSMRENGKKFRGLCEEESELRDKIAVCEMKRRSCDTSAHSTEIDEQLVKAQAELAQFEATNFPARRGMYCVLQLHSRLTFLQDGPVV